MKILYIAHYFHPFSVGGVEDYARTLARVMHQRGHDVHVFHGVIDQGHEDYHVLTHEVDGVPCTCVSVDLKTIEAWEGTWKQKEVERVLERLLDEFRPDVVHIQHLTRLSTGIGEVLRRRGIPSVLTLHDYWMQCARGQRVKEDRTVCHEIVETACADCMAGNIDYFNARKPLVRRALERAVRGGRKVSHLEDIVGRRKDMLGVLEGVDLLLTPSLYTRDTFRSWGVQREITIEHIGVEHAPAARYRETSSPRLRFGFLGKFIPTKGVEVLLDAFKLMDPGGPTGSDSDSGAELLVHGFGDGTYDEELKARGAHPRIRFPGGFAQEQVPDVYATFDVQVVPSVWLECSPFVIHTARLYKKPVIVSAIGGMIEMVRDGVDGLKFPVGDAPALAAAMKRLVQDRDLVRRMRESILAAGSLEEHSARMADYYERLASRS